MNWLEILNYTGTFAFALTGALKAVKYELDLFGILVLATVTGIGGSVIRDAMLTDTPSSALGHNSYLFLTLLAGLLVFVGSRKFAYGQILLLWFDALGLGTFTAIACMEAEQAGICFLGYPIIAAITACGGGIIRDLLVREIPIVIKSDFYASASILGALFFVAMDHLGMPNNAQMIGCVVVVTLLRLVAIHTKLELPKIIGSAK